MTPAQRRAAVGYLQEQFGFSAAPCLPPGRRCALDGPLSGASGGATTRRCGGGCGSWPAQRPRFGYRRLHVLLRREGIVVNHKRIERLYREEGLAVRRRRRKSLARIRAGSARRAPSAPTSSGRSTS